MLTIVFFAIFIMAAWKLFAFGMRLTWGIARIAGKLLFLLLMISAIAVGVLYIALPILIIIGVCGLIGALVLSSLKILFDF